ncbi:MAG: SOS response-associated peptidase [Marinosulfonomonas sp.]|nr:SOS response-associated peptidase [Marinosulfonomonas sp.]
MCGRFAVTLPTDAMAQLFDAAPANNLPDVPNFNVCPTNQIHTVHGGENGRQLVSMRWGFIPHWYKTPSDGPLLINARAETIAQKPAFRAACRQRRCLIPISGFYEWTKTAQNTRLPWYIFSSDGAPQALAGIWQDWDGAENSQRSCAIVTTAANPAMSTIHHRMPVILELRDWALWLGENGTGASKLMTATDEATLKFHRVGTNVNSNKSSGPELIEEE